MATLRTHLSLLRRQGVLNDWTDREIRAGEDWKQSITTALEEADIIVLLVSADMIASDFCWSVEMKRAMQRHATGVATVVPIFLRSCDTTGAPFMTVQGLPKDAVPITTWTNQDQAWTDVAKGLRRLLTTNPR